MTILGLQISMTVIWLVVMIAFLAVEILTVGLVTIWFAGGALAALVLSMFNASPLVQIIAFFVVSIGLLVSTRKIFVEKLQTGKEATNADAVIGEVGQVIATINPLSVGQVKVMGQVWSAIAEDQNLTIESGTVVTIMAIEGVKLIVTPKN